MYLVFIQTDGVQWKSDDDVLVSQDVWGIKIFALFIDGNHFHMLPRDSQK